MTEKCSRTNFITILALLAVLNLYTPAFAFEDSTLKPENVYAFDLGMVEHHIGVKKMMTFLLTQPYIAEDPDFLLLLQHKDLVLKRAEQHDLSKFKQTPDFVSRYYPTWLNKPVSSIVYKYYGRDIRKNPEGLSSEQIYEAKAAFQTLNSIDDRLLIELLEEYSREKNLDTATIINLERALDKFEHVVDLVNRKLLENLNRYRTNSSLRTKPQEIFEFGHMIDLNNMDPHYWGEQAKAQKVAIRLYNSPTAMRLMTDITPEDVVATYLENTKESTLITEIERMLKAETIERYIAQRSNLKPREKRGLLKKPKFRVSNKCSKFYDPYK